jgi:phage virion morphogenesis protein
MIEVEVNTEALEAQLGRAIALGANMTPITRALAGVLEDIPERAFANQADPTTGQAWAPLSPATVKRRGSATPILQVSGALAASIQSEYGPDFAQAGTATVYAPPHQFGARKGAFGTTSRGRPIPWGDIPARPIFGVGPEDEAEFAQVALEGLQRVLEGR